MLDLKFIRENPDCVRAGMRAKNREIDFEKFLRIDHERLARQQEFEISLAQKNQLSEQINSLQKSGEPIAALIEQVRHLNEILKKQQQEISAREPELLALLSQIPNLPHPSVPPGTSPAQNRIVSSPGPMPETDFPPKPHWEIAGRLGLVDFAAGSRLAGSFFVNLKGLGARLNRALINFMLDLHTRDGYLEVAPPYLAKREMLFNTGQLPLLENEMYHLERDDLFLIPTGEIPLTNLHQNEILDVAQLPLKYVAATPCFRREAGTHGRENRGLIRIHQFDKVELVQLVEPEKSGAALESLRQQGEKILKLLELPYRVVELCAGELSFASAKCYDLEVWAPGVGKFLEVSSCCNFEAFQARRANIRFRVAGRRPQFVHTLNASGVALPRTLAAILENNQTDEGSVLVPKVLQPYLGTAVLKAGN
jgi:seryl-tRNA synthetase